MVNRSLFKVAELNHTASGVGKADMQLLTSSPPCNSCRSTSVPVSRHSEGVQGIRRELVDEQLSKYRPNWAACNKNEQQYAKNNAEL